MAALKSSLRVAGLALVAAVALACLAWSAAATDVTESMSYSAASFGSVGFTVVNLPPEIPVVLGITSSSVTSGVMTVTGATVEPETAARFTFSMRTTTLRDSSVKFVDALPPDSQVSIRSISATNANGLTLFDFGDMFFSQNVTVMLTALTLAYTAVLDIPFVQVGGAKYAPTIDRLSSLQVMGASTTGGSCLVALGNSRDASSSPLIGDRGLLSVRQASVCGLSKSVVCVAGSLVVADEGTVRAWGVEEASNCAETTRRPSSLMDLSNGAVTVGGNSFLMVKDVSLATAEVFTMGSGSSLSSNAVIEGSRLTLQNITAKDFCSVCKTNGFTTVSADSSVFAGAWVMNGAATTDFNSLGQGGAGGSNQPTQIEASGVLSSDPTSCSTSACLPGTGSATLIGGVCTCNCETSDHYPSCTYQEDAGTQYSACDDPHCFDCTINPTTCSRCFDGYNLVGRDCKAVVCEVPNCRQCAENDRNTCVTCTEQYRPENGKCVACPAYCVYCSSDDTCTQCTTGYTLTNGKCVASSGCQVPYCDQCDTSNSEQCVKCSAGYGLTANKLCARCTEPNCASCPDDFQQCKSCSTGYTITIYGTCSPGGACNVEYCEYCDASDPNTCTGCTNGYILNTETGKCVARGTCSVPNCQTCESESPVRCATCIDGYAVDSNGKCADVTGSACKVPNCAACQAGSTTVCATCASGYSVTSTGQCSVSRCRVYYCTECQPGSDVRCRTCYSGYGLTTEYTCVQFRTSTTYKNGASMPSSLLAALAALVFTSVLAML